MQGLIDSDAARKDSCDSVQGEEPWSTSGVHYDYAYEDRVFFAPDTDELEQDEVNDMDPMENGDWATRTVVNVCASEWSEAILHAYPEHVRFYVS